MVGRLGVGVCDDGAEKGEGRREGGANRSALGSSGSVVGRRTARTSGRCGSGRRPRGCPSGDPALWRTGRGRRSTTCCSSRWTLAGQAGSEQTTVDRSNESRHADSRTQIHTLQETEESPGLTRAICSLRNGTFGSLWSSSSSKVGVLALDQPTQAQRYPTNLNLDRDSNSKLTCAYSLTRSSLADADLILPGLSCGQSSSVRPATAIQLLLRLSSLAAFFFSPTDTLDIPTFTSYPPSPLATKLWPSASSTPSISNPCRQASTPLAKLSKSACVS